MRKFRGKYPIIAGILVMVVMILAMLLASVGLSVLLRVMPWLGQLGEYALQLPVELAMLLVMAGMAVLLGMQGIFTCRGRGFLKSLIPAAVLLVIYALAGVENLILSIGSPMRSFAAFFVFLLCMAAVGITEEITFRGLIAGMIYDKYGATPAGVWLSVIASSLIFGMVHITNAVGGEAALSGVLIQMAGASAMGMCLAAVYFRGRNIWAVAAVHGFMDCCALLDSGLFYEGSMIDTIGGYTAASLVAYGFYVIVALVLLRPSCMKMITSSPISGKGETVKLGIVVGLLGAMVGAVIVWTV
mgnify:FL=1